MSDDGNKESKEPTNTAQSKSRRRSERVVLRVSLLLSAMLADDNRISIEAQSLVVNAHGGLLKVGMEIVKGQSISLRNPMTDRFTTARVLRVERMGEGQFSVGFEFESPCPEFWPISFPPTDWALGSQAE